MLIPQTIMSENEMVSFIDIINRLLNRQNVYDTLVWWYLVSTINDTPNWNEFIVLVNTICSDNFNESIVITHRMQQFFHDYETYLMIFNGVHTRVPEEFRTEYYINVTQYINDRNTNQYLDRPPEPVFNYEIIINTQN